ncbi:type II secretion system minor pseudopilin GspJ [Algimonas porphyrae]|uniref:Type II secretion system protein J n=1 Tax=Algimonas porphyrae TaxID=1128113 RepID=A0ABQ5V3V6_9PROT|nr:type II secretion system minor pseudopilin GspJ [Algimonas porphyrae]GLQ21662.1 type II secretion system protein GspJ [Algimonas porphyrae]
MSEARPICGGSSTQLSAGGDAGFTLVEVLVSMFIFSLISVGALIALSTTLDAREKAQARIENVERLAAARRLLADDIGASVQRTNRDGLGGFIDPTQQVAQPDQLIVTRRGRPNPDGAFPRGDLLRVAWRVENGQLIRAFLPHENPAYVEPPIDRVVLIGVERMEIMTIAKSFTTTETVPLSEAVAVFVTFTHTDGTTTRHLFEISDV